MTTETHDWVVVGHSTGPHPILFMQCVGCGATTGLPLTNSEWADYLQHLADAGRGWVDDFQRRAGLSGQGDRLHVMPGETSAADSDNLIDEATDEIHVELRETALGRQRRLARLIDSLDLFDEGDDVPF